MKYLKHIIAFMLCVIVIFTGVNADGADIPMKNKNIGNRNRMVKQNEAEQEDRNIEQDEIAQGDRDIKQEENTEEDKYRNIEQEENTEEDRDIKQDEIAQEDKDIHKEQVEKEIKALMKEMTWKEKVAQMIFVSAPSDAVNVQKRYQFGGYILFASDFEKATKASIKRRINNIQDVSEIPMLIAVDEEGGTVVRASKYKQFRSKPYASPRSVYASGKWDGIIKDTKSKAKFLKSFGINTNLAPVADIAYKKSDFIYERSFSTNVKSTSKYIKKVVNTMGEKNLISTLKHFPGYGNNGDTHTQLIHDYRSKGSFEKRDLKPFQAGIDTGCDMIMVSHNIVHCFDSKNPASISPKVISYLRNDMGFEGVIVTDSLTMSGVVKHTGSVGKSAVRAVLAGNDLLCTGEYKKTYNALIKAVKNKEISKRRIDESVKRILLMKYERGII